MPQAFGAAAWAHPPGAVLLDIWTGADAPMLTMAAPQDDLRGVDSLSGNCRLAAWEARAMRRLYATGQHTQSSLAERFGVSQPSVSSCVTGATYSEAGGPLKRRGRRKMDAADRAYAADLKAAGATLDEIAARCGVSRRTVVNVFKEMREQAA